MVHIARILCRRRDVIGDDQARARFIDALRVYVRGGGGGQGLPKYGGVGGKGGDVYFVGKEGITLKYIQSLHPKKRLVAGTGGNSRKHALLGSPGQDLEVPVPLGVCVKNEHGRLIGEVNSIDDKVLVSVGGAGGNPYNDYAGQRSTPSHVRLDLKLIADIGLVGFPNAGKSTLLNAVSKARPRIADYPFTTITPQLGVMMYSDRRQITMADLPGLIEGAHINIGMGHRFLKHVERTKLLLFVVDVFGFQLGLQNKHRTAFETIVFLNKELEMYRDDLLNKPAVLVLNKIDKEDSQCQLDQVMDELQNFEKSLKDIESTWHPNRIVQFQDIIPISAREKQSTEHLKDRLRELLDTQAVDTERLSLASSHGELSSITRGSYSSGRSKKVRSAEDNVRLQLTERSNHQLV